MKHALEKKKYFTITVLFLFILLTIFIFYLIDGIETKANDLSEQTKQNIEALKNTP